MLIWWLNITYLTLNNFDRIGTPYFVCHPVLEWANDMKLHVFATKHKANTYSEKLIHSDDCVSI
jgi:hypothetical protein